MEKMPIPSLLLRIRIERIWMSAANGCWLQKPQSPGLPGLAGSPVTRADFTSPEPVPPFSRSAVLRRSLR